MKIVRPKSEVESLISEHIKFAYGVANHYYGYGMDCQDLQQEALIGLTKAAKRFDPSKGFKFTTFAVWWIKNEIMQAINANGKIVRIPCNKLNANMRLRKYISKIEQEIGRPVTCEEIAEITNMTLDSVKVIMGLNLSHKSLDTPISDGDTVTTFGDCLEGDNHTDGVLLEDERKGIVSQILNILTPIEAQVISMSYGLDGNGEYSKEEIAKEMNISLCIVDKCLKSAMKKLRSHTAIKKLLAEIQ